MGAPLRPTGVATRLQVFEKLKPVIALYEERKESIIVEGVRPSHEMGDLIGPTRSCVGRYSPPLSFFSEGAPHDGACD